MLQIGRYHVTDGGVFDGGAGNQCISDGVHGEGLDRAFKRKAAFRDLGRPAGNIRIR